MAKIITHEKAAFAKGWRDGRRGILGPTPSRRMVEQRWPHLTDDWSIADTLLTLYLNGYEDGVRGDRFRLDYKG